MVPRHEQAFIISLQETGKPLLKVTTQSETRTHHEPRNSSWSARHMQHDSAQISKVKGTSTDTSETLVRLTFVIKADLVQTQLHPRDMKHPAHKTLQHRQEMELGHGAKASASVHN